MQIESPRERGMHRIYYIAVKNVKSVVKFCVGLVMGIYATVIEILGVVL